MTAIGTLTGPVASRLDAAPTDCWIEAQDTDAGFGNPPIRVVVVRVQEVPHGPVVGRLALGAEEARHLAALLTLAADR